MSQQKTVYSALSVEERDAVAELVTSPGWKPLLKLIDVLVEEQERAVLRLNVEEGVDKLLHAKLKSEGARKLRVDIEKLKSLVKEKE